MSELKYFHGLTKQAVDTIMKFQISTENVSATLVLDSQLTM